MEDPKFHVGQAVETVINNGDQLVTISDIHATYTYTIAVAGSFIPYRRNEGDIHLPKPSPEEAWEKAALIIGMRAVQQPTWVLSESWNKETRHQVYQILGAAGIRVTDEVKQDVRRLIALADMM